MSENHSRQTVGKHARQENETVLWHETDFQLQLRHNNLIITLEKPTNEHYVYNP